MPGQNSLEQQMNEMRSDMREMRGAVGKIADAISKLAVLEERHQNFAVVTDRRLSIVEAKADNTQLEQVKFTANLNGVTKTMKVMWTAFGAGVLYLGGQLFTFLTSLPA